MPDFGRCEIFFWHFQFGFLPLSIDLGAPGLCGKTRGRDRQVRQRRHTHGGNIRSGGNGGGHLVNARGEVVGINTWGYKQKNEGAYSSICPSCQTTSRLYLRENGIEPQFAPGQTSVAAPSPIAPPASSPSASGAGKPGSGSAEERRRDVRSSTVQVLGGWSVLDQERDMILLRADDDSAAIGVLLTGNEGLSRQQVAKAYADEFKGSRPVFEDDVYTFSFEDDEVKTLVSWETWKRTRTSR